MKSEFGFGAKESLEKFEKLFGFSKPVKKKGRVAKKTRPPVKKIKKRPKVLRERLGFNPLASTRGQLSGVSSIVEENLINPKFEKLQPEIEKAEPLVEIENPEIEYKPKIQAKKTKAEPIVRKVKRKKPEVVKKIKAIRTIKAKPLVGKENLKIGKRVKVKLLRKVAAQKLVKQRMPKLKVKAAPKLLPEARISLGNLTCTQRKHLPGSEIYWCFSRRARYHGSLGARKVALGKCAGCHVRELPK